MPNKSIYIKDEDQHLFDRVGPNLSEGLASMLREKYRDAAPGQFLVSVTWNWSKKHRQSQIEIGDVPDQQGEAELVGIPANFAKLNVDAIGGWSLSDHETRGRLRIAPHGGTDTPLDTWEKILALAIPAREAQDAKQAERDEQKQAERDERDERKAEQTRKEAGWQQASDDLESVLAAHIRHTNNEHLLLTRERGYAWIEKAYVEYAEHLLAAVSHDYKEGRNEECHVNQASTPSLEALRLVIEIEATAIAATAGTILDVKCNIVNCTYTYIEDDYDDYAGDPESETIEEIRVRVSFVGERLSPRYHDIFFIS